MSRVERREEGRKRGEKREWKGERSKEGTQYQKMRRTERKYIESEVKKRKQEEEGRENSLRKRDYIRKRSNKE